ncbi:MAG: hypothetical protein Q7S22_05105 [Candidatus Micrarchaeota archaeon]|nr:hypothetical protein [Candidatus Micrarchaeota archaeon]
METIQTQRTRIARASIIATASRYCAAINRRDESSITYEIRNIRCLCEQPEARGAVCDTIGIAEIRMNGGFTVTAIDKQGKEKSVDMGDLMKSLFRVNQVIRAINVASDTSKSKQERIRALEIIDVSYSDAERFIVTEAKKLTAEGSRIFEFCIDNMAGGGVHPSTSDSLYAKIYFSVNGVNPEDMPTGVY